jgi:outer membrane lipoprotein-sorting protein
MFTKTFLVVVASLFTGSAVVGQQSSATPRLTADQVVGKVQNFYEGTQHLTAKFRQTYHNKSFGKTFKNDGRVWIKKKGKMRWDYFASRGKVKKSFLSDGQKLWGVEYDNKQYYSADLKGNMLPVAVTFLSGEGDLKQDFTAKLDTSGKRGKKGDYVVELTPKKPSARYKTLWLVVNPKNYRVTESVVLETSKRVNRFMFFEPDVKSPVKDSFFVLNGKAMEKQHFRLIQPKGKGKGKKAAPKKK